MNNNKNIGKAIDLIIVFSYNRLVIKVLKASRHVKKMQKKTLYVDYYIYTKLKRKLI